MLAVELEKRPDNPASTGESLMRPWPAAAVWATLYGSPSDKTHLVIGEVPCHWCGSPCGRVNVHDDLPPVPFIRSRANARYPWSAYQCNGCLLFRRQRVSITFLGGIARDGQAPRNFGWWLTDEARALLPGARGTVFKGGASIGLDQRAMLWRLLFEPPRRFALSLLVESRETNLHDVVLNDHLGEINAGTVHTFTLDNRPLTYSVYELEQALRYGPDGREPGVVALCNLLGPYELPELPTNKGGDRRGRPKSAVKQDNRLHADVPLEGVKKIIVASGVAAK
jgi:hypothetical protein